MEFFYLSGFRTFFILIDSKMLSYYISSGVYGNILNYISKMVKKKGKVRFFMSRIFRPLNDMKIIFPILNRVPVLLPICWVMRVFQIALAKERRKNVMGEFKALVRVVRRR